MTIDDVKTKLIKIKYDIAKGEIIRHRNFEREEHLMQEEYEAVGMAIASLDAWEKAKAEIEELEKSYGFDKATKYGNKDGKQMDLSYSTMFMYEIAGMVDEIKEIIYKHLQEVTG